MLTKENIGELWLEKAEKRSIEKFGFDIVGVDLVKLKESINERDRKDR